jgi:N utilization substance protein A
MIANLLASEGFLTVDSLAQSDVSEIASIEGFDEDIAGEVKRRAEEFLQKNS